MSSSGVIDVLKNNQSI